MRPLVPAASVSPLGSRFASRLAAAAARLSANISAFVRLCRSETVGDDAPIVLEPPAAAARLSANLSALVRSVEADVPMAAEPLPASKTSASVPHTSMGMVESGAVFLPLPVELLMGVRTPGDRGLGSRMSRRCSLGEDVAPIGSLADLVADWATSTS